MENSSEFFLITLRLSNPINLMNAEQSEADGFN